MQPPNRQGYSTLSSLAAARQLGTPVASGWPGLSPAPAAARGTPLHADLHAGTSRMTEAMSPPPVAFGRDASAASSTGSGSTGANGGGSGLTAFQPHRLLRPISAVACSTPTVSSPSPVPGASLFAASAQARAAAAAAQSPHALLQPAPQRLAGSPPSQAVDATGFGPAGTAPPPSADPLVLEQWEQFKQFQGRRGGVGVLVSGGYSFGLVLVCVQWLLCGGGKGGWRGIGVFRALNENVPCAAEFQTFQKMQQLRQRVVPPVVKPVTAPPAARPASRAALPAAAFQGRAAAAASEPRPPMTSAQSALAAVLSSPLFAAPTAKLSYSVADALSSSPFVSKPSPKPSPPARRAPLSPTPLSAPSNALVVSKPGPTPKAKAPLSATTTVALTAHDANPASLVSSLTAALRQSLASVSGGRAPSNVNVSFNITNIHVTGPDGAGGGRGAPAGTTSSTSFASSSAGVDVSGGAPPVCTTTTSAVLSHAEAQRVVSLAAELAAWSEAFSRPHAMLESPPELPQFVPQSSWRPMLTHQVRVSLLVASL